MVLEMLLVAASGIVAPPPYAPKSQSTGTDAGKVAVIREHIDMFEASARLAKDKTEKDPQAIAALEKQYAAAAVAFENWRTAAGSVTEKDWSASRKRIEELSKAAARAISEFGRDARAYVSGREAAVDSRIVGRFETRLGEAARALSRTDDQTRLRLTADLMCRPWNEIR